MAELAALESGSHLGTFVGYGDLLGGSESPRLPAARRQGASSSLCH